MAGEPGPDEGWVKPRTSASESKELRLAVGRLSGEVPQRFDGWMGTLAQALNRVADRLDALEGKPDAE